MSISSRINEIETHLKTDYTNLEALGYDLPQDKNIENIANVLDNVWENQSHIEETGTTLSMNTNKGKAKVDLLGNTSQIQYTGKNLFNVDITDTTEEGVSFVVNADKTISTSGTSSAEINLVIGHIDNLPIGEYITTGCPANGGSSTYRLQTTDYPVVQNIGFDTGTGMTFTSTGISYALRIQIKPNTNMNGFTFKPMIRLSSASADYEPYCGGIPSPNPSYPQPIHVVSGDNSIIVCGKNLFDYDKCSNTGINNDSGNVSTQNSRLWSDIIRVVPNATYSFKTTAKSSNNEDILINRFVYYDANKTFLRRNGTGVNTNTATITIPNDVYYVVIDLRTSALTTALKKSILNGNTQFVKGNSVGTYTPYQSQIYPISLGNLELCKIGDYQDKFFKAINGDTIYDNLDSSIKDTLDYGYWYLEKNIGKVVLNGSENWTLNSSSGDSYRYWIINDDFINTFTNCLMGSEVDLLGKLINDHFIQSFFSNTRIGKFSINYNSGSKWFLLNVGLTTAEAFKTWLSTHNTEVYYVLATPTYTKIEGTLVSQLEDVWRANTYDNQTNVSQVNNDLPFELFFKALGTPSNTLLGLSRPSLQLNNPIENVEETVEEPIEEIEESGEQE